MSHSLNNLNSSTLEQALARVQALDLERITKKVGQKQGWDDARAEEAQRQYQHYLALLLVYPGKQIAPPSKDADEIWHGHILDTPAYHSDCEQLFGNYLHHVPSYGTAQEKVTMAQAREQSEALFERHFGKESQGAAASATETAFCVCMAEPAKQDQAQETAFCVCMAEPAKQNQAKEEAGCVPCFANPSKKENHVRAGDGCVPCLGRRVSPEKAARVETDRALCFARQASDATVAARVATR